MNSSDEAGKIGIAKLLDCLSECRDNGWSWSHILPESLDRQLDRYMVKTGLERDATGVVCLAIALQLMEHEDQFKSISILDSPVQPQFDVPAVAETSRLGFSRARTPAANITVKLNAAAIEEFGAEQKHFFSMVLQVYPLAWKWIVQLAACYQVNYNRVDSRLVVNYFKHLREIQPVIASFGNSLVSGAIVLPYIKFAATKMKSKHRLVEDEDIRATFLTGCSFIKRYTTFSATAELCRQLIDGIGPESSLKIIGAELIKVVDESLTNYWDPQFNEKIPVKLRAVAAVYAQVQGKDYGNWKQGEKALSETPPNFISTWRSLFRRLKQLKEQE